MSRVYTIKLKNFFFFKRVLSLHFRAEALFGRGPLVNLCVDLCLLQFAAVVDIDCLPFREYIEDGFSRLPMTITRVLYSTEREMYFRADRRTINVSYACLNVPYRLKSFINIVRID